MLSRSRRPDPIPPGLPAVGPGSYDNSMPSFKPKTSMAPFNSTCERDTGTSLSFCTPGPGAYVCDPVHKAVRPSPQFLSKEVRIAADKERLKGYETPGPGAYEPPVLREIKPVVSTTKKRNINWAKVATAPSIPSGGEYCYEPGPGGELVLRGPVSNGHSGVPEDLPGPGEYDPVKITRKTGTDFSKSAGRKNIIGSEKVAVPGPGSYELLPKPREADGPSSMFVSTTSRSQVAASSKHPGPGTYKMASTFQSLREHLASNPETFHAFGSTGKQNTLKKDSVEIPGPGSYFETANLPKRDVPSSAFASAAARFPKETQNSNSNPGPGEYEVQNNTFVRALSKKVHGRFGHFGSTTSRFPQEKELSNVSPASYSYHDFNPAEARRPDKRTAPFKSQTKNAVPKDQESAAVFYDAQKTWPKPTTTSTSFISSVPRFVESKKDLVPGPGQYNAQPPASDGKVSFGQSFRFSKGPADVTPGPGSYETTPSMIRKTFNITIGGQWD